MIVRDNQLMETVDEKVIDNDNQSVNSGNSKNEFESSKVIKHSYLKPLKIKKKVNHI